MSLNNRTVKTTSVNQDLLFKNGEGKQTETIAKIVGSVLFACRQLWNTCSRDLATLLLNIFRASPQLSWLSAVNVPGFHIWPQAFQEGHPQNECYTHLTLNATVKLKKKGIYYFKSVGQRGECPSAWPLCSSSFTVKPSFIFLLILPSFVIKLLSKPC